MGFRRSIDHPFNPMLTKKTFDQGLIANIPMHKYMPGMRLDRLKISKITGVFQRVEIHHLMAALHNQATYEMRPNESGSTGYEDSHPTTLFEVRRSSWRESHNLFAPVFATSWLARWRDSIVPASVHQPSNRSQVNVPSAI